MSQEVATRLFYLWLFLLLPCLLLAPISLMAIGDAPGPKANIFVGSIWTYPAAVGIVAILRKRAPMVALLPCVNIVACLASGV